VIRKGFVAGITAGIAVAIFVLVHDLLLLEPFATPSSLSRNLIANSIDVSDQLATAALAASWVRDAEFLAIFTGLHLLVFAGLGIAAAWLFLSRQLPANVWTGALFGMTAGSATFYLGTTLVAPDFLDLPDWRLVLFVNAIAGVVIVAQLLGDEEPGA